MSDDRTPEQTLELMCRAMQSMAFDLQRIADALEQPDADEDAADKGTEPPTLSRR